MLATILNFLASVSTKASTSACAIVLFDEPKMPKSLIK